MTLDLLRRYLALSDGDRRLVARAFGDLALADAILRVRGIRSVIEEQRAGTPIDFAPTVEELRRARRYAHWLDVASRHHFVQVRCLQRSLALHRWLRREGLPSTLRIGVRKESNSLRAHAWVELGEHIVNDQPEAVAIFTSLANPRVGDFTTNPAFPRSLSEQWHP